SADASLCTLQARTVRTDAGTVDRRERRTLGDLRAEVRLDRAHHTRRTSVDERALRRIEGERRSRNETDALRPFLCLDGLDTDLLRDVLRLEADLRAVWWSAVFCDARGRFTAAFGMTDGTCGLGEAVFFAPVALGLEHRDQLGI